MTRWSPFFDQVFPRQHRIDPRVVVVNPLVSIFHPNEDESELWWYSNRLKRIQTRCPYIVLFHCSPVLLFFQLLMHAHFSNGRRQDHNVWACTIDRICVSWIYSTQTKPTCVSLDPFSQFNFSLCCSVSFKADELLTSFPFVLLGYFFFFFIWQKIVQIYKMSLFLNNNDDNDNDVEMNLKANTDVTPLYMQQEK